MRFCCPWGGHVPGGAANLSREWLGCQAALPSPSGSFPPPSPLPRPHSPRSGPSFPRRLRARCWPALLNQFLRRQSPAAGDWQEVLIQWRAGDPAATALRGFIREIRRSAELPSVIAPHTIRERTGNCGAADRYAALIQLSLQPLLAKIRGNWNYK